MYGTSLHARPRRLQYRSEPSLKKHCIRDYGIFLSIHEHANVYCIRCLRVVS